MPISKINTSSITDNSVTAGKIVAGAVDADIAAGSIDTAQMADDAVTADKLANAINTSISNNTAKTGISSSQTSAITANTAKVGVPAGAEIMWATSSVPSGWLEENGASISRSTYAALFAVIGVTYGSVDGNTFNLPDARGEFIRGWAHGSANDPDRAARTNRGDGTTGDVVGSKQADQMQGHKHAGRYNYGSSLGNSYNTSPSTTGGSGGTDAHSNVLLPVTDGTNGTPRTGLESRPRNINKMIIIKY